MNLILHPILFTYTISVIIQDQNQSPTRQPDVQLHIMPIQTAAAVIGPFIGCVFPFNFLLPIATSTQTNQLEHILNKDICSSVSMTHRRKSKSARWPPICGINLPETPIWTSQGKLSDCRHTLQYVYINAHNNVCFM